MNAAILERPVAAPGPCPVIETRRLVLRPHAARDADAIAASLADFRVTRTLARVPVPYDRHDALDWLSPRLAGLSPGWALAVTLDGEAHVGVIEIEPRGGQWHIGYWLNRFYWRRGYMGEAVSATLDRFFRRMPQARLHAGVFADNPASLKLQERLGFRITGADELFCLARNAMLAHIRTALDPQDFRPLPPR